MGRINVRTPDGRAVSIPDDDATVGAALEKGYTIETVDQEAARAVEEGKRAYAKTTLGKIEAGAQGFLRGVSFGGTDVLQAAGNEDKRELLAALKAEHPGLSAATEIGGAFFPAVASGGSSVAGSAARATPAGAAAALGARVGRAAEGAGAVARIGRGVAGGAVEGALQGVGQATSDLALSSEPLTIDRIASALSSGALYGGVTGGAAGGAVRGLEVGLGAARRQLTKAREAADKLDNVAREAADKLGNVADDFATLDRKGLRARETAERARIEAARVPQRAQLADDIAAFRATTKQDQPWVAVASGNRAAKRGAAGVLEEGAEAVKYPRWVREQEKLYLESDKMLDRVLRDPKGLAKDPRAAEKALRQQEAVLETIVARSDELRALHVADRTGRRAAALETVPRTLEANRALQQQIADLAAPASSPTLSAIADAVDALETGGRKSLGQQMAGGTAYGIVADLVRSVPFVGPIAAPFLAARAADAIGGRVASQLAAATREAAERTGRVVDRFIDVTKRTERAAPIIASRVLGSTRFAPEPPPEAKPAAREVMTAGSGKGPAKAKAPTLDDAYDARASEIASSVVPGPDGRPTVRSGVRQGIASRLAPIAAVAPHVADRLETHAVRRLEFLAARMPRPTQIGMTRIRPPEMAIRAWARYVAAADDPGGVEERLVDGTITPEDAETMRELYPDRMAEITRMIIEELPSLRATLPYQRRLALSIFTGAPVDAAMDPRILAVLQAQYADERGTEGGVQAPTPQPAFGSIQRSTPTPTPAQSRGG